MREFQDAWRYVDPRKRLVTSNGRTITCEDLRRREWIGLKRNISKPLLTARCVRRCRAVGEEPRPELHNITCSHPEPVPVCDRREQTHELDFGAW